MNERIEYCNSKLMPSIENQLNNLEEQLQPGCNLKKIVEQLKNINEALDIEISVIKNLKKQN